MVLILILMPSPSPRSASNGRTDTVSALIKLQPQQYSLISASISSIGLKYLLHTLSLVEPEHTAVEIVSMLCTHPFILALVFGFNFLAPNRCEQPPD